MIEGITASCSSAYISAEELLLKLRDSKGVVLDCRERGPNIKGAYRVRLPKVLLRRLNAGTLPPNSINPALIAGQRILVLSEDTAAGCLAEQVYKLLLEKGFDVQLALVNIEELFAESCELMEEPTANGGFNEVGTLSLENLKLNENRSSMENLLEKRRAADIFPVEILPHLFLGNADTAANRELLDRCNIRYIINVTRDLANSFESDGEFHYLKIAVDDSCSNNLAQHFPAAIAFIERATQSGSAVLVHCLAGISRSVTVCLAYLMHARRSTLDEAFDLVHKRNALISPNFHFMGQLCEFERQLADSNFRGVPLSSSTSPNTSSNSD